MESGSGSSSYKNLKVSGFKDTGEDNQIYWRGAGVAELARLESVCTPKGYRGFESLSLRKINCRESFLH